ncbi:MAG: hypothetical protein LAT51_01320 [Flavobacteriaceae bacterium]|nr:hypothetical protein [Flavobacteriaceae bacterium]
MIANKNYLFILLFIGIAVFSQEKPPYPKDTIHIKYEFKTGNTWNNKFDRKYKGEKGIYFNIVTNKSGDLALFASHKSKFDTLNIDYIKSIKFLDLKKIKELESNYYKDRFGGNPWIKNKNAVFVTYVIEQINEDCIVKYPVIWRNEGVTD